MTKLDEFTLNVLCNAEVIDIDQDSSGKQGRIIAKTDDYFIMLKELEDGSRAVGFFNTAEVQISISVSLAELQMSGKYRVRDLWRQKDVGIFQDSFEADVGRHGVMLVRFFPVDKSN